MVIDERVLQGARAAENIRPNLLRLRNLFGLTNSVLSRITHIKRQTLVNKLNGNGQFTGEELARLAAVWGIGIERLFMAPANFRQWVADHEEELEAALRSTGWLMAA
jgi:plasmid maintenance system antidote protein VapI